MNTLNSQQAKDKAADALAQIRKAYDEPYGHDVALGIAWAVLALIAGDVGEAPWEKYLRESNDAQMAVRS